MTLVITILLWLLKLIGILLATVLGLVLLLLLLILCVPIRYQADLEKAEELIWGGRISWLFRFLQFRFQYTPTENTTEFRIGFFRMSETEEEKAKPEKNVAEIKEDLWQADWQEMEEEEFKRKLFDYLSAERSDQTEVPETAERIEAAEKNETVWEPVVAETESRPVINEENEPAAKASAREEGAVIEKIPPEKDSSKPENKTEDEADIWSEFEAEYEKEEIAEGERQSTESSGKRAMIETAWWIFQKLRAYFRKNRGVIRHVLRWPWRMLRSVLPRRADGRIEFGLGDPAHTGYVLSLFYLFYPENHGKMEMVPDFEKMMFVGQAAVKGRSLLIEIVYYALRLIIDVRIIRLLFLIRTLKAGKAAEEEKLKKKRNQEERDSEEAVLSVSAQR